jgi:hypothetical protein
MAALTVSPYGNLALKLANKEIDLDSDTLKATLHTSSYTPNLDTHDYVDDLTNELSTASGYTVAGVTVAGTISYVAANSWATTRANSTAYALGDVRRPATGNGFLYRAAVAGTSAGTIPTYPTVPGTTVADGGVTWTNIGHGALLFDIADPTWSTFSAGPFRYMVISDRTPGTAATQPLIALGDWGSDQTGGGGSFTVQIDPSGLLVIAVV